MASVSQKRACNGPTAARRWCGRWIWAEGDGKAKNVYYYFRRDFVPTSADTKHRLFITADTRYQVYVNGKFVGRGPPQSQPYLQYYDEYDVGAQLVGGRNCLAIIVNYVGNNAGTRGGLLAELVDGRGQVATMTGADWRVARAKAWRAETFCFRMNKYSPYQEMHDAREVPVAWDRVGFDDSRWDGATVVRCRVSDRPPAVWPWTNLVPRDIPFMVESTALPLAIEVAEECLAIANRVRSEDLSIGLSVVGGAIRHCRLEGVEHLCSDGGETMVQSSTKHLDRVFDGVYDPCVVLDFGKVVTAYARIELDGVPGGVVDIGYAERLIDGRFNNALEGQFADCYVMTEGRQSYQPFTWKAFRYLKLRFSGCCQPVGVRSVKAVITSYPFEEQGSFQCDEPVLNAVFDICRYTIKLCCNECIMDTPWREQGQWLGDVSAVTLGGIYACFGDTRLPGKFLRQSAANQLCTGLIGNMTNVVSEDWMQVIPDYSLWWIRALWNHYQYTGDESWIHEFYPHVMKVIGVFVNYIDEHGLVADMPYWVFVDWADVEKRGQCAVLNALFYGTLEAAGQMARLKRDSYSDDLIEKVRAGIRASFVRRLYDLQKRCFSDANLDGVLSPKVSEHANCAAILWGLCDEELAGQVVETLYESRSVAYTEAQPFFTTVVLQALDRAGRFDLALEVIRNRWGRRMVERGASSTYEEWGTNGSWRSGEYSGFLRSLSHAWSAHPAEFLIRNVVGVEIAEPGCGKVRLRPRAVPFDYSVALPTPHGPIRVSKSGAEVDVSAPAGVQVLR